MSKVAVGVCVAIGTALICGVSLSGQEQADVLEALLKEVRQLRVAIESAAATNARLQMAVQRANIQEERLWRVSREVEALRTEIANASEDRMNSAARLKRLDEALSNATDHEQRLGIEHEIGALNREVERQQRHEKRLRDEEGMLSQTLQIEEARWGDVNQKLDELERLTDRR